MSDIYITLAIFMVVGGVLAVFAQFAFNGLFGRTSPWRWSWLSRPRPTRTHNPKLTRLITALEIAGLVIAAIIFVWHFGVSALPDTLVWSFALPMALLCAVGRAKAIFGTIRSPRRP